MGSVRAFPYLTLTDEEVIVKEWYPVNHEDIPTQMDSAEEGVPDWAYDEILRLGREIKIDTKKCLYKIGLGDIPASLKLTVLLEVGQPGIRHNVFSKVLSENQIFDEFLVIEVPGANVSENIKLSTIVTLNNHHKSSQPFVPVNPGSRLWEDRHVIPLEGHGSRFPMRSCSFKELVRVPDHAEWFLEWSPDLADHAFAGAVLLYINSDNKDFSERITDGDETLLASLRSDIAIEMCAGLLANKDFREGYEHYEPGSIGAICNSWLTMAFPGRTRENLYQILQDRTSEFFTSIRAALR